MSNLATAVELPISAKMDHVLGQIRWFADQHKLTPEQVQAIFNAGLAARSVLLETTSIS